MKIAKSLIASSMLIVITFVPILSNCFAGRLYEIVEKKVDNCLREAPYSHQYEGKIKITSVNEKDGYIYITGTCWGSFLETYPNGTHGMSKSETDFYARGKQVLDEIVIDKCIFNKVKPPDWMK